MPSSSIAQILLRLFALQWFLTGLIQAVSVIFTMRAEYFRSSHLTQGLVPFLAGIILWFIAPKLSRLLARGNDGEVNLKGVTDEQLYTGVFLGLGLYFTLSRFGAAFSWLHFFATNQSAELGFSINERPSYYDLTETVMALAAGIFLIVTCKTWARKLAGRGAEKGTV